MKTEERRNLKAKEQVFSAREYLMAAALVLWIILAPQIEPNLTRAAQGREVADWIALSHQIFVARVVDRTTCYEDGKTVTRYSLRVSKTFRGRPPGVVNVVESGGAPRGAKLPGSRGAEWRIGSEYLVFARTDDLGRTRPVGGESGALRLIPGRNGGQLVRLNFKHPLRAFCKEGGSILVRLDDIASGVAAAGASVGTRRD